MENGNTETFEQNKTEGTSPPSEVPGLQQEIFKETLKQAHEYVRHIFHMFLLWFNVFATVNYLAMGWLSTTSIQPPLAWIVPPMFFLQNVLSLFACYAVWRGLDRQIRKTKALSRGEVAVPRKLYSYSIALIAMALALTAITWAGVGVALIMRPHP